MSDEKKIIIDEDWKKKAKAEKEKLAKEVKDSEETDAQQESQQLPEADFSVLVSMLSTQALFAMGLAAPEGMEDKVNKDFKLAQFNIDLLSIIEEKTKGNLSKEETELLTSSLSQLRMMYVNLVDK